MVTRKLRAAIKTDDGSNAIQFIATCLNHLTTRLNDENDAFLSENQTGDQSVIYQRGGRPRHIPVMFLHSILMLQSCQLDKQLMEAWFDATGSAFTAKLGAELGPLPSELIDFLLGSLTVPLVELATRAMDARQLGQTVSSWMYQSSAALDVITARLDGVNLTDIDQGNTLLEKCLQLHVERGGRHGLKCLDLLKRQRATSREQVEVMDTIESKTIEHMPSEMDGLLSVIFNTEKKRLESQRALRSAVDMMNESNVNLVVDAIVARLQLNLKHDQFAIITLIKKARRFNHDKSRLQNAIDQSTMGRLKPLQSVNQMETEHGDIKQAIEQHRQRPHLISGAVKALLVTKQSTELRIDEIGIALQSEKDERKGVKF